MKLSRDPISKSFISKTGVIANILRHPPGLSTIGTIVTIGGCNGRKSGETFVTLKSKLLDSIIDPKQAFQLGISTHISFEKEFSIILLQFCPDVSKEALNILRRFFDGKVPTTTSQGVARNDLSRQEFLGLWNPTSQLQQLSCSASFGNDIGVFSDKVRDIKVNEEMIKSLKSKCILLGSGDQEEALKNFAESLPQSQAKIVSQLKPFSPGMVSAASSKLTVRGNRLVNHPLNVYASLSWNAASFKSEDYFTYKVLETLLGGASSFSSEGLGVGIVDSVLAKYVLYRTPMCEEVRAQYTPYSQQGLLSVWVNVPGEDARKVSRRIRTALENVENLPDGQFASAREQSVSKFLRGVDERYGRFEEFARQTLLWGEAKSPTAVIKALRSVTKERIIECLKRSMSMKPSVAVIGNAKPEEFAFL